MKRIKAISLILAVAVILPLLLTGCIPSRDAYEVKLCTETLEAFFTALENNDAAAVKSLFSKTVIEKDTDLDAQIEKLIEIYPSAPTEIFADDLNGGDYSTEYGAFYARLNDTVPVFCDGEYYWVEIYIVYEDQANEDNIGVESIAFFTADEYCAWFHDDENKTNDLSVDIFDDGLSVYADLKLEGEIRPIHGIPHEFTSIRRIITASEVDAFIDDNKNITDFVARFGEPNARCGEYHYTYFYELLDDDGRVQYLELGVSYNEITYASIVSDFKFIRSIYDLAVS